MEDRRFRIERMLLENVIKDRCSQAANSMRGKFDISFCSNSGVIRFTTSTIDGIFTPKAAPAGHWRNGQLAFYEVALESKLLVVALAVSKIGLNTSEERKLRCLLEMMGEGQGSAYLGCMPEGLEIIRSWRLIDGTYSPAEAMSALDGFLEEELPCFEAELRTWASGKNEINQHMENKGDEASPDELANGAFVEGAMHAVISDEFERSSAARLKCIAAHGAKCAICDFDFGEFYGAEFSGKIEVHHIVPLNIIRESYEVDPVRDLIPICPNCHFAIHSKPGGGTYLPEELCEMRLSRLNVE